MRGHENALHKTAAGHCAQITQALYQVKNAALLLCKQFLTSPRLSQDRSRPLTKEALGLKLGVLEKDGGKTLP
ncbi:MAG: hypothetical protein EBU48_02350 [Burkholderiaceae bacterium]|nr:hypothetical protein [Burkholderiaceae bacterium]